MGRLDGLFDAVTDHSRIVIAVLVVLTVVVGAGAGNIDQSSSLDQFQSESEASEKLSYIETNFTSGGGNTTSTQLIVRDENVLEKDSLVAMLEMERAIRANETVSMTLAGNDSIVGIANVVATASMRRAVGTELQRTATRFERLNRTVAEERAALERDRATLQQRREMLNKTSRGLRSGLDRLRENPNANVTEVFEQIRATTTVTLDERDYATFEQATRQLRNATSQSELEQAYTTGTQGVLAEELKALRDRGDSLAERGESLREQGERLRELGQQLADLQAQLEEKSNPTLEAQLDHLRSMNQSDVDDALSLVLSEGANGGAFAFMPTGYEPGTTSANATVWSTRNWPCRPSPTATASSAR